MGGVLTFSNLYYGCFVKILNSTFANNRGQFGGILFFYIETSAYVEIVFLNSVFEKNTASKSNSYLSLDISQGGCIIGFLGDNTHLTINNSLFIENYSPKGFLNEKLKFILKRWYSCLDLW